MKTQNKFNQEHRLKLQKVFLVLVLGLTAGLLIFRLAKANSYVDDSKVIFAMEKKLASVSKENEILTEYIQEKSSLTTIREQAESRGMVATSNYTYLPAPSAMALGSAFRLQ